jgi:trehalose 6-phosphate phosphatase
VPEAVRRALATLNAVPDVNVALVTGRDAASVDAVAGSAPVWRAVSHGRTVLAPDDPAQEAPWNAAQRARLAAFRRWAEQEAVPEGARLEDKDGAVAVHARSLAERDSGRAEDLLERARARADAEGLHVRMGRAVCEAELEAGDKGTALAKLQEATGAAGTFYAGDDLTDAPAIARAMDTGGLGVFVRSPERQAPERVSAVVDGTDAVASLIDALVARLKTR